MNRLSTEKRARVVAALVEGCSIRSTVRMTGVAKNTVVKLLADLGQACAAFHDEHVRKLRCDRIQCDEIWSFVYAKQKNVPDPLQGVYGYGDVWTWTAIDADTKLCVSWLVGLRNADCAKEFMLDIAGRVLQRLQLTTDGLAVYLDAVENAFGGEVDYAQLVKLYGSDKDGDGPERKYSPGKCNGAKKAAQLGVPSRQHISTSYVERANLTMRMSMRRFTRLTNAFSKKVENLEHAVALHFVHYNFCRVHQTLRMTPAMKAGLADHVWGLDELVGLLQAAESN